jgi:Myb-like DNA-binding domain
MATIEPRLIHLLNDSTTPQLPHADLPPLQTLPFQTSSDRPLPLEPNASHGGDQSGPKGSLATNPVAPLYGSSDDGNMSKNTRVDAKFLAADRPAVSNMSSYPLRLLLAETEAPQPSHSLSKILEDTHDGKDDTATKKRNRAVTIKDDFVQLPQPVKKQKATQQLHMPPIINGLHEPPPDAALFPPMSFGTPDADTNRLILPREAANTGDLDDKANQVPPPPTEAEKPSSGKGRKRAAKPRRKWSEEETRHLLLGVNRHGVGKWTNILEDPDFQFNGRTAGDLKDRFRTCCPDELRAGNRSREREAMPQTTSAVDARPKAKSGLLSENILIETEELNAPETLPPPQPDSDSNPKQRKTRAHRKKMEDLAELGIHGPFKKSHRRERRPFTEQDDREILDGLEQYGPAWTKIQRDPRFNLSTRQPTDLRDRVRNKYPEIYQRIEKGTLQIKGGARGSDILEPSINMTIENSLNPAKSGTLEPHLSKVGSREDIPKFPLSVLEASEHHPGNHPFELSESAPAPFIGGVGEMDISRLLLDDSQLPQAARDATWHA